MSAWLTAKECRPLWGRARMVFQKAGAGLLAMDGEGGGAVAAGNRGRRKHFVSGNQPPPSPRRILAEMLWHIMTERLVCASQRGGIISSTLER